MVTAGPPLTWETDTLLTSLSLYTLFPQRNSVARFVQPPEAQVENVNASFRTLNLPNQLSTASTCYKSHRSPYGNEARTTIQKPQRKLHHNHNSSFDPSLLQIQATQSVSPKHTTQYLGAVLRTSKRPEFRTVRHSRNSRPGRRQLPSVILSTHSREPQERTRHSALQQSISSSYPRNLIQLKTLAKSEPARERRSLPHFRQSRSTGESHSPKPP